MKPRIRILIAEDHVVARVGVTTILNLQPDMRVVAAASHGGEVLELFTLHRPDVTLLDLRMPILSGIEAALAIRAIDPAARMIALTSFSGDHDIRKALAAGMNGYLTKDVPHDELLAAIRAVHAGDTYLPAALATTLETQPPCPHLSSREVQVLTLLVNGLANKEIAHKLEIAQDTAKFYVKQLFTKLGVQDRTQAATAAIRRGIIHL